MRIFKILAMLISIVLIARPSPAIEDEDERYPSIVEREPFKLSDIIKEPVENLELNLFAGSSLGHDDNIYLTHYDPVASFFTEHIFSADARYPMPILDWIKLKLGYDLTHLVYFRTSEVDLLDNVLRGGCETILYDIFTIDFEYNLDFVNYPKDEQSNYVGNQMGVGVKHDITDWLYHRFGWEYLHKDFEKRPTRSQHYIRLGDREDWRHTFEHRTVLTLFDNTLLKVGNKLYFNDSNNAYYDYYDYRAYKLSTSLIHLITDKISGQLNFAYQSKKYDQRIVSDEQGDTQRDHLFIYGGSLLYDITPALSLGVNYTYRKNISNEGNQKYGGSIVSCGAYYSF